MIEISMEFMIFAFVVSFISFFVKGIAGFGDPLISSPLLSLQTETKFITPSNLILNLIFNLWMTWKNRKFFSVKSLLPMLTAILIGVTIGSYILTITTSWVLKAVLGIVVIGLGIEMATRGNAKKFKGSTPLMLIVSLFSGISAGLYGINLFFVAYLERTSDDRGAFRGKMGFIFFIENIYRVVLYTVGGVFTKDVFMLLAICLPGAILGFVIGAKFDKKLPEIVVRRAVYVVFIAGGLSALIAALQVGLGA